MNETPKTPDRNLAKEIRNSAAVSATVFAFIAIAGGVVKKIQDNRTKTPTRG